MVYLGIDYGSKRIGLALANSEANIASPLVTLDASAKDFWNRLIKLIRNYHVNQLVVGLPRGLNGGETGQTKLVRDFAAKLVSLGLTVHLQDEAGTSALAEERIGKQLQDKGQIDAEAAAIILQDFLDNLDITSQPLVDAEAAEIPEPQLADEDTVWDDDSEASW